MTIVTLFDLVFTYVENTKNRPLDDMRYHDIDKWFKKNNGNKLVKYVCFIDLVHVFNRNRLELGLSDAYCSTPLWSER